MPKKQAMTTEYLARRRIKSTEADKGIDNIEDVRIADPSPGRIKVGAVVRPIGKSTGKIQDEYRAAKAKGKERVFEIRAWRSTVDETGSR